MNQQINGIEALKVIFERDGLEYIASMLMERGGISGIEVHSRETGVVPMAARKEIKWTFKRMGYKKIPIEFIDYHDSRKQDYPKAPVSICNRHELSKPPFYRWKDVTKMPGSVPAFRGRRHLTFDVAKTLSDRGEMNSYGIARHLLESAGYWPIWTEESLSKKVSIILKHMSQLGFVELCRDYRRATTDYT